MDSNASQSPGPDSSRRRSGRVAKAPEKFAPVPTTNTASKRKRDLDQEADDDDVENDEDPADSDADADMTDGPAGESNDDRDGGDGDDSDDDNGHTPRLRPASKKKSSTSSSRPRKPASKRVKTNGAPAASGLGAHPASLPSRPKKSVRIERLPEDGTGLFADIFGSGDSSDRVAEQWLTRYREDNVAAITEIINCVLQCCGCELEITDDDIRDPDNCANRLTDIQGVWQDQQITDYPLIAKAKSTKSFRDLLTGFFVSFVNLLHATDLLYTDESLMDNVHRWVATMSSSTLRPFRHTATTVSLAIQAGLVQVASTLDKRISGIEQQIQTSKRGKNKEKTQELQRNLDQANGYRDICANFIKDFFDTVFVHRYRDVDPRIRTECVEALGYWIWELASVFMAPEYLRYLGWMLTDVMHTTRQEVLKQLTRMFKRDASDLGHFIDRFRPRLVEIATRDAEVSVRVSAISVIDTLREKGMLEPDEIDGVGKLIFDSDPRVRKAVAGFFIACVEDLSDSKIEEMGGNDVVDEVFGSTDVDDYETPHREWIQIKCLAETLAAYESQIESSSAPVAPLGLDVSTSILQAAVPDTRMTLAAQALYERMPEVKQWEVIAGYILYDHTTSAKAQSRKGKANPEATIKAALAPAGDEEAILLEVMAAAARLNLSPTHYDHSRKKGHRADALDDPEEGAVQLVSTIPRLLNKFGADPETATLVLRLERVLDLDAFPVLRQDPTKYEKLLDEISTQFNRHDDNRVLAEVTRALLRARQFDELEELTDNRVATLWENVVEALRGFDKYCEISSRGNLEVERLTELRTVLAKISDLASISDCIDVLETEGRSADSSSSVVNILIEVVNRGKFDQEDRDIDDLEDQVVDHATQGCQFYFMWKIHSVIQLVESGVDVPVQDLKDLSYLKDKYRRTLEMILTTRHAADELSRSVMSSYCDFHVAFSRLRLVVDGVPAEARAERELSRITGLVSEINDDLAKEVAAVFEAAERHYARVTKKTLNDPGEDEDPIDDEEDDEDGPLDEGLSPAERLAAQLQAEKRLCDVTGKIVLAIQARVLDATGGRLRRRLLRNATRLGNNYKETVAYLDNRKVAELLSGGKKKQGGAARKASGQRQAAPGGKTGGNGKVVHKSVEVIDDEEDEDDDRPVDAEPEEEGEDEENEELQELSDIETPRRGEDDDDILGD